MAALSEINPIEYLKHLDPPSLFQCYFVSKYFQTALENRNVLKALDYCLHSKQSGTVHSHPSYTFSDLVYRCDKKYLTSRSKKYVDKQRLLNLAGEAGNIVSIHSSLKQGAVIDSYFLWVLSVNKHYDLYDEFAFRFNPSPSAHVTNYIERGLERKVFKRVRLVPLVELYRYISHAMRWKQNKIAKLLITRTVSTTPITDEEKGTWGQCFYHSIFDNEIFEMMFNDQEAFKHGFETTLSQAISTNSIHFDRIYLHAQSLGLITQKTLDILLNYAVCCKNERIKKLLLKDGARYTIECIADAAVEVADYELAEQLLVQFNTPANKTYLEEYLENVYDSKIEYLKYFKDRGICVDDAILNIISYENSDTVMELFTRELYPDIVSRGMWHGDYKLIEKYLPYVIDQSDIIKLCQEAADNCENIKCAKLLFSKLTDVDRITIGPSLDQDIKDYITGLKSK